MMRMAPVQVAYLGYPYSTGLKQVDYRIVDALTDPVEEVFDSVCSERLYRMDRSFLCFESLAQDNPLSEYVEKQAFTFGGFNTSTKYTDSIVKAWVEILKRVPGSKLLLKAKVFVEEDFVEEFSKRFTCEGIDKGRLQFVGWTETKEEHLALYNQIDVHLDTFPFNGATTTFECLWQGVPTITLEGRMHRARVTSSVLSRLGKEEWIASTFEEYVAKAVDLVKDREQLRLFKSNSRIEMEEAGLLDGRSFVKELDKAFRFMYGDRVNPL